MPACRGALMTKASALMQQYLAECRRLGHRTGIVDLSIFTDEDLQTYSDFLTALAGRMRNAGAPQVAGEVTIRNQSFMIDWMERSLLPAFETFTVLAFDEVDRILGRPYQTDFFRMLRFWIERMSDDPPSQFSRLGLVLVISTEPYLLIEGGESSPFNVRLPVELDSFSMTECQELNDRYGNPLNPNQLQELHNLLDGQPYLTRLAFYHLTTEQPLSFQELEEIGRASCRERVYVLV